MDIGDYKKDVNILISSRPSFEGKERILRSDDQISEMCNTCPKCDAEFSRQDDMLRRE